MLSIVTLSSLGGCESENVDNGLSDSSLVPSFTITPVEGAPNKFTVQATQTKNVLGFKWDYDDGAGMHDGKEKEVIFLPDAGTYNIVHGVVGRGGIESKTAPQNIVVTTPDPIAGNLLKGGKLVDATEWSQWTLANPTDSANIIFAAGSVTFKATNRGIYQAVNVVAGKKYVIDLVASSTSGCSDTWFEVYCGYAAPTANADYSDGGKIRSINTWDGCGKTAFAGKISAIGCKPDDNKGIFTAAQTGTVYLLVRCGGGLKDGITVKNIEMRPSL